LDVVNTDVETSASNSLTRFLFVNGDECRDTQGRGVCASEREEPDETWAAAAEGTRNETTRSF